MRSGGKGASPGDLSLLFHIVKVAALVLFRSQDVAPPFKATTGGLCFSVSPYPETDSMNTLAEGFSNFFIGIGL